MLSSSTTSTVGLFFPPAAQADVVRSFQKDQFYKKYLSEQIFDVVNSIFGPRIALHRQKETGFLTDFFYYLTALIISRGKQTLGEEYCDLVQVNSSNQRLPSSLRRFLLILISALTPFLLEKYGSKLNAKNLKQVIQVQNSKILKIIEDLPSFKETVEYLLKIHVAVFYFKGAFYEVSKRATGIEYVFNHVGQMNRMNYNPLGILIFIQMVITLGLWIKSKIAITIDEKDNWIEEGKTGNDEAFSASSEKTCTLCLENVRNSTSTPCGHVFCWNCITEWCNSKRECPLDRLPLDPNSLICLYNY